MGLEFFELNFNGPIDSGAIPLHARATWTSATAPRSLSARWARGDDARMGIRPLGPRGGWTSSQGARPANCRTDPEALAVELAAHPTLRQTLPGLPCTGINLNFGPFLGR